MSMIGDCMSVDFDAGGVGWAIRAKVVLLCEFVQRNGLLICQLRRSTKETTNLLLVAIREIHRLNDGCRLLARNLGRSADWSSRNFAGGDSFG